MSSNIISLLTKDSFLFLNKALLRELEGDAYQAILLTELITLSQAFKMTDQMKYNGNWFFRSVKDIERDTCINDYKQRTALESLEKKGFIETRRAGRPAKRFFRVKEDKLLNILSREIMEEKKVDIVIGLTKEQKKIEFYRELNYGMKQDFKTFKSKVGNIKKHFALFMYTWGWLYRSTTNKEWVWTPETFGKLNLWFAKRMNKDFDYSDLDSFFQQLDEDTPDSLYIPKWLTYSRNIFEKAPSEKVLDPSPYWIRSYYF